MASAAPAAAARSQTVAPSPAVATVLSSQAPPFRNKNIPMQTTSSISFARRGPHTPHGFLSEARRLFPAAAVADDDAFFGATATATLAAAPLGHHSAAPATAASQPGAEPRKRLSAAAPAAESKAGATIAAAVIAAITNRAAGLRLLLCRSSPLLKQQLAPRGSCASPSVVENSGAAGELQAAAALTTTLALPHTPITTAAGLGLPAAAAAETGAGEQTPSARPQTRRRCSPTTRPMQQQQKRSHALVLFPRTGESLFLQKIVGGPMGALQKATSKLVISATARTQAYAAAPLSTRSSNFPVGGTLLLVSFLLSLLLVSSLPPLCDHKTAPAAPSSSSYNAPAGRGLPQLLPVAALPLSRRGLFRGGEASALAAPSLYSVGGSTAVVGPAAAAGVRHGSRNNIAERQSSYSCNAARSSSSIEERRGNSSSTTPAFVSPSVALRRGGAEAGARQQHQLLHAPASAAPHNISFCSGAGEGGWRRSVSRRESKRNTMSAPVPLRAAGSASWTSPSPAFSSSIMHRKSIHRSSGAVSAGFEKERKGRNLETRTTEGDFFLSAGVPAGARLGAPLTAAAAAAGEANSTRLVGSIKEVTMPALSSTMKEGRVVSWLKQVGDRVQVGDVLMVVESDKADMDVEAFDAGFMAYHAVAEGSSAPVGSTVALIAEHAEDLPIIEQQGVSLHSSDGAEAAAEEETAVAAGAAPVVGGGTAAAAGAKSAEEQTQVSELVLPALGSSSRNGHIAVWKKKEGEFVRQGEILFIVESDKADMDVEAPHDGVLARILVDVGVKVPVGTSVGWLAKNEEAAAALPPQQPRYAGENAAVRMPEGTREVFLQVESPATMISARVVKWLRKVGDHVKLGEKLVVVEDGNGQALEISSGDEGYLAATRVEEQQQGAAGQTLALLVASPGDVAVVQQALQQQQQQTGAAPSASIASKEGAAAAAGGTAVEFSSFPHKKEAAASLATWTFPSVDQDVNAQLPPGLTPDDLRQEFLRRLQQRLSPEITAKMRGPQGAEYLERLSLRVPPPHTLRDVTAPAAAEVGAGVAAEASPPRTPESTYAVAFTGSTKQGGEGATATTTSAAQATGMAGAGRQQASRLTPRDPLGSPLATEHATALAAKHNLFLEDVKGTGTHARVTLADVQRHLRLPADETEVVIRDSSSTSGTSSSDGGSSDQGPIFEKPLLPAGFEQMDAMQKAVARNMEATLGVPVFKVSRGIYVDKLEALLQQIKHIVADGNTHAAAEGQQRQPPVTMTVLLAKAVALTLVKHPLLNASYDEKGGQIKHPGTADIALAVSLDGGGLVTPVLRAAEKKNIFTLAKEWSALTEKAKQRRLTPAELTGGTFYISNLGMYGVQQFGAVLPRGVGTIMAVGAAETLPHQPHGKAGAAVVAGGGGAGGATAGGERSRRMTVTLTCDHRHIYGTHAALFLKDLADLLETRPSELLIQ